LSARKGTVEPPLLLDTKFYPPSSARALVPRPRLRDSLARGTASKLMLVSAPAGFGKSTLLAQWLTEWLAGDSAPTATRRAAAWLSLDRDDDVPHSFWTYLVAALCRAVPDAAPTALELLQASPPAPVHTVVTALLNDLGALESDVVLVLDDYHVVDSREVHEEIAFLLDHLPPRLHLVMVGRADPALPLARMRARAELVEIRAAELRFTADEALAYLNDVMGLELTAGEVATLEGRTEGWIAALQLAALSMQGRDDVTAFIVGFAGDDRYIVDYLVEEVLGRQPAEVRDFLLQTSVLRRLSGPLCDAVTGRSGGKSALEALERGNLFLVPLDDRRQWYRYHHLFADVLRAHLLEDHGDELPELHRRASAWFEQNAEPSEAIRHALAGNDHDRAADLMELAFRHMLRDRREVEVRSWVRMMPAEVVRRRPVLGMGFVAALASGSEFDTIEERLRDIEQSMLRSVAGDVVGDSPPDVVVVDEAGYLRLPGNIALYRAALDLARGDVDGTVSHARQAILLSAPDDDLTRASAAALSGLASWSTGDLESAYRGYAEGIDGLQRVGWLSDVLGCCVALADLRRAQGRLGDALRTCEEALELTRPEPGSPPLRGTADMHVSISEVLRERDDLPGAMEHLTRSQQLGEHNGLPQNTYRWRVAMARLREADGDLDGALELLDVADRVYVGDFFPNVRPVPAVRARLHIVRGELTAALAWAQERRLSPDDELTYLREYEHVTIARLLLARHTTERAGPFLDEAAHLLERLLAAADEGERTHSVIEILILQARAHQARGDAAAIPTLQRAVTLAEPEGFVRLFADEGPPMANLLRGLAKQGTAAGYVRRLTAASLRGTAAQPPVRQALVEPLSERELDVLRLLGTDLDGPDIARELNVSLNTMRTHTKNIYAKLGVTSRRAAVSQAHELDLLPSPRHR
jgi:LuxR family maltose regulon positive regulatory protein